MQGESAGATLGTLADDLTLIGRHRDAEGAGGAEVTLLWRAPATAEGVAALAPYTVFVHLYDGAGALAAQADGVPLGGTLPFTAWQPGDVIRDVRRLSLAVPPGDYTLGVGLYRGDTGERAPALGADGARLADDVITMPVSLP